MLLRNFYNQLTTQLTGINGTIANGLKNPNGTLNSSDRASSTSDLVTMPLVTAFTAFSGVKGSYSARYICVGSGSTPPTVDDYKLENLIKTVSGDSVKASLDGNGNCVLLVNIKNTDSGKPIVINEVGLVGKCYYSSSGYVDCLIERTVLDEPLTLGPGESGFISYKVRFAPIVGSFPTA